MTMTKAAELRREIAMLEAQKSEKEQELRQLQEEPKPLLDFGSRSGPSLAVLRPEEKIALFFELFGARLDVYPKFWENPSSGKKGYSPAYANGVAGKRFLPLDEHVIEEHLRGHQSNASLGPDIS